jgi:hypothetical protein
MHKIGPPTKQVLKNVPNDPNIIFGVPCHHVLVKTRRWVGHLGDSRHLARISNFKAKDYKFLTFNMRLCPNSQILDCSIAADGSHYRKTAGRCIL